MAITAAAQATCSIVTDPPSGPKPRPTPLAGNLFRSTRIGKHIRFRVEHLDELVAAGEQPVTSDVIPIQRNRTRSKL